MASGSLTNVPVIVALVAMNVFMSIVQTNIAPLNLPISLEFHQNLYGLGLLTSGFFVAYGIFELPGGLLAFRVGAKKLLVVGGLITSAAAVASAGSPTFDVLIALRFLTGMGLGFAFPPVVVLLIRNLRTGSVGLGAALVLTSFSIGGGIGVFGWAVLSLVIGWRESVLIGGVLCLLSTLVVIWMLPADGPLTEPTRMISALKSVVFNRQILVIAIAFLGAGAATAVVTNFMVYYLEQHLGLGAESAGVIGGLAYAAPPALEPLLRETLRHGAQREADTPVGRRPPGCRDRGNSSGLGHLGSRLGAGGGPRDGNLLHDRILGGPGPVTVTGDGELHGGVG